MIIQKPEFWKDINIFALLLFPLTIITYFINFLKRFKNSRVFKTPIICVGNVYVGGTGKTPLSIFIFNLLKKKSKNPAIIKKYYREHQDEIDLIKARTKKLYIFNNRITSIEKAEKKGHKSIILDDGLQDLSFKKKLKIACFNGKSLVGNGLLLPAGPLRENLSVLKDCEIAVINGSKDRQFEKKIKLYSKKINIFYSRYVPKNINRLKNLKILAFAGIGNPNSFFNLLQKYKINISESINFPDHYSYSKGEIKSLLSKAKKNKLKLLTTEKDFFRIKKLGFKVDYLSVNLEINNKKYFEKIILNYL